MRMPDDYTYQEYKDSSADAFNLLELNPKDWKPENVTDWLMIEDIEETDEPIIGTSRFLYFLSIGLCEVRRNILEYRIENALAYHIYRYENMGRYKEDLTPEEIKEVEKDIAYIKSKVKLPELVSYEDFD